MTKQKSLYLHTDEITVGKSVTKQSGAMTPAMHWRAFVSGQPLPDTRPPIYADIAGVDLGATRNIMAEFDSEFQSLPAHVRDRFKNDSDNYFDFLEENNDAIESDGFRAVLSEFMSPPNPAQQDKAENAVDGDTEAVADNSAQKGATDDESGT